MKKYLILSPYALHGTRNSGDDLIIGSLIELLNHFAKENIECRVVSIAKSTINKDDTFNSIDIKKYNALLVPGFRVTIDGDEILDIRLRYMEKAIINNIPVFCVGSSWCCYPGIEEQTKYKINPREKALLKYIKSHDKSLITARDIYTKKFLHNNLIDCDMTGDLALYDINKLNTEYYHNKFIYKEIKNIAISLPHNQYHFNYCAQLKYEIEELFGINVKLVTHQYLKHKEIFNDLIDLSGSYKNLDEYNNFDMHLGFRLHGHLWFLRNRKPSMFIAEDGRGLGHLKSFNDIGIHSPPKYIIKKAVKLDQYELLSKKINRNTRVDIDSILRLLENNTPIPPEGKYISIFKKIDDLWNEKVKNIILKILEV
jgi:hypothetical protein